MFVPDQPYIYPLARGLLGKLMTEVYQVPVGGRSFQCLVGPPVWVCTHRRANGWATRAIGTVVIGWPFGVYHQNASRVCPWCSDAGEDHTRLSSTSHVLLTRYLGISYPIARHGEVPQKPQKTKEPVFFFEN